MNDSEPAFISGEVVTNFGTSTGHSAADPAMLNEPGAVAGEYVSLGIVTAEAIAVAPQR